MLKNVRTSLCIADYIPETGMEKLPFSFSLSKIAHTYTYNILKRQQSSMK